METVIARKSTGLQAETCDPVFCGPTTEYVGMVDLTKLARLFFEAGKGENECFHPVFWYSGKRNRMTFSELNLAEPVLRAVTMEKYSEPTPIQEQAIPHLLAGRDILGCAQTGTGKTAAFALPIVNALYEQRNFGRGRAPRALILAPTRELAAQVGACFTAFGKFAGVKTAIIFGGVGQGPQVSALRNGVDVVVATPGRLVDLLNQKLCDLRSVKTLVLDEADHMLDLGFIYDVKTIIAKIPKERQTLLFSATMPKEIAALAASILREPVTVAVTPVSSAVESVKQSVYHIEKADKGRLLVGLLQSGDIETGLVFSRTKHGADKITKMLNASGIKAGAIHGNKSQTARQEALSAFKKGKLRILVATDIAARGIDVHALPHVVNYDLPDVPETYIHRIGRTGRAGLQGAAISFCDTSERGSLRDIESLIAIRIPTVRNHPFAVSRPESAPAMPERRRGASRQSPTPGSQRNRRPATGNGKGGEATRTPMAENRGCGWRRRKGNSGARIRQAAS